MSDKFKVGDRIVCVEDDDPFRVGDTAIVTRCDEDGVPRVTSERDGSWDFAKDEHWELASKKPEAPALPVTVELWEAAREYAALNDKENWCQRLKYGQCSSRKCNVEGGWKVGEVDNYSRATCPRFRLEQALAALNPPEVDPLLVEARVIAAYTLDGPDDQFDETDQHILDGERDDEFAVQVALKALRRGMELATITQADAGEVK